MGFEAGPDGTESLARDSIPGPSSPQRVPIPTTYTMPAALKICKELNYKTTEQLRLLYELDDQHIGRGAKVSLL
jgi:hypothetical protein